ncbi:MAG: hypothetical protein KJO98_15210, partial [Rhodothermia bacterium]|nr:hypothetical protein [Rhodothermia bacterium]
ATAEDSERELEDLFTEIEKFSQAAVTLKSHWRALLDGLKSAGKTTAIWGAGSKAVGFLTTLGITDQIVFGVDINPYRSGTFLAGCGHEIVSPDLLKSNPTDIVVVMNPVYENEIKAACDSLIRKPTIVTVADDPALLVTQLASHK